VLPQIARVSLYFITALSLCYAALFIAGRRLIPQAFSHNHAVVEETARAELVIAGYVVLDAFQTVGQGVLRGAGKQAIGAFVSLVSYYGVTIPAAALLAFVAHLHLRGLWYGMLVGNFTIGCVYVLVVVRLKWHRIAALATAIAKE
jgi:MATE family multidrug resistance protein